MDLMLKNKKVILTGGSRGIGFYTAKLLVSEGCKVAFCSREQGPLVKAEDELNSINQGSAIGITTNLESESETTIFAKKSLEFLFKNTGNLTNNCRSENYIFLLGFPLVSFAHLEKRIINRYKCVQIKRLIEKHSKLPQDTVINEQLPDGKYPTRKQFLILLEETFKAHCPTSKTNKKMKRVPM